MLKRSFEGTNLWGRPVSLDFSKVQILNKVWWDINFTFKATYMGGCRPLRAADTLNARDEMTRFPAYTKPKVRNLYTTHQELLKEKNKLTNDDAHLSKLAMAIDDVDGEQGRQRVEF